MAPEAEEWRPFRPHEQKVAAALLVVLKKCLRKGLNSISAAKYAIIANNPIASHFLELIPDTGELPSLKQLGGRHLRRLAMRLKFCLSTAQQRGTSPCKCSPGAFFA